MADPANNINVASINHNAIRELANAISEANAKVYQELGDIAKTSRGPGGLGTSKAIDDAIAKSQANSRGFSGGSGGARSDAGPDLNYYGPSSFSTAGNLKDVFRRYDAQTLRGQWRDQGRFVTDEAAQKASAVARGFSGENPNLFGSGGVVDPGLYGGNLTAGSFLRLGSNALYKGSQAVPYGASSERMVSAAATLRSMGNMSPYAKQGYGSLQNMYHFGQGLTALGSMQGTSGAGTDLTIPGTNIGFRSPINAASIRGAQTLIDQFKGALPAGINMSQMNDINSALISQGFNQGNPRSGGFRNMYGNIIGSNEALNNPMTYSLGEAATRFQGADSMARFTQIMKDLPGTADRASFSLSRMQSSMAGYVQADIHSGATPTQSMGNFMTQLRQTGMDPASLQSLENNTYVKAGFARAGYMPWQIGRVPGSTRTRIERQSMTDLYNLFGGQGFDPNSAQGKEAIAKMQQFGQVPLDTTQIQHMLDPGKFKTPHQRMKDASNIINQYGSKVDEGKDGRHGALTGSGSGHQLADLRGSERDRLLRRIENDYGMSDSQKRYLNYQLGNTSNQSQWHGDWEKTLRGAMKNRANEQGYSDKSISSDGGGRSASDLLNKAASALTAAAQLLPSAKSTANAGGNPTANPNYGATK